MKCNSKAAQLQKAVNYAVNQRYDELFDGIQTTIAQQLIAAMLYTLEVNEGYGKTRIRRVFDELTSTFDDMDGVGFAGSFDSSDLVDRAKERYGIDLREEVQVGRHKNKG